MSPPGNENGKAAHPREAYGSSRKLNSDDTDKIAESGREGKPANVERLEALGIPFRHRPADHDIKLECPVCGNVLWLHDEKPWHYCGWVTCSAWSKTFDEIFQAIAHDRAHRLDPTAMTRKDGAL